MWVCMRNAFLGLRSTTDTCMLDWPQPFYCNTKKRNVALYKKKRIQPHYFEPRAAGSRSQSNCRTKRHCSVSAIGYEGTWAAHPIPSLIPLSPRRLVVALPTHCLCAHFNIVSLLSSLSLLLLLTNDPMTDLNPIQISTRELTN